VRAGAGSPRGRTVVPVPLFLELYLPAAEALGEEGSVRNVGRRAAKHLSIAPESAERRLRTLLSGRAVVMDHATADAFLLAVGVLCLELPAFADGVASARAMVVAYEEATGEKLEWGQRGPFIDSLANFSRGFVAAYGYVRPGGKSLEPDRLLALSA
jgi:hypothetical protein